MDRTILAVLALTVIACATPEPEGVYYASGQGSVSVDGLHRVDWEPFKVTYVKPGADLARYDKVLVDEVSVSYKTPPTPAQLAQTAIRPNYALPEGARASIEKFFRAEFTRALAKSSDFTIADAAGPGVLRLSGHILDLSITVPPEADQAPDETEWASSPGSFTLVLDAQDSQSGETLVRVGRAETLQLGDGSWYQVDPVANSGAVQEIFRTCAESLRSELDQFHDLPQLPPADDGRPQG